jgi:hypothetical protein
MVTVTIFLLSYLVTGALKGQKFPLPAWQWDLANHIPAAKINAPIKRPANNLVPLQQPHPLDEQFPSFLSSDIMPPVFYNTMLLRHPFGKALDAKNNDQHCHEQQGPDLVDQIKKAHAFKDDPPDDLQKIGHGDKITDIAHPFGHGFPGKNKTRKQNGRHC